MSTLTLPGFANVHSHAFQRLMRGEVQRRHLGAADAREATFWTWRERMYAHANRLGLEAIEAAALLCYVECLEGGYTAVGEFHYLHHAPDGTPWPDPLAASKAHLRAAEAAGIRLTLLWCVYAQGGFGLPPSEAQRRFVTRSLGEVEAALDGLGDAVGGLARAGLAIHSVRAVPRAWLGPLAEMARARGLPLHVHAAEQRREVTACREHCGLSPIALLAAEGVLGETTTVVHGTWLDDDDIALLAKHRTWVALCPTTEGDLGDGVPRVAELHAAGVRLCIGSDSHAVIDPFAELRAAEYLGRVRAERRCVLSDAAGEVAPVLLAVGCDHGHAALGWPEAADDVVELDLGDRVFEGVSDPLATALVGGHRGLVRRVVVGGRAVVEGGRWRD